MSQALHQRSATDLAAAIRSGECSSSQVVQSCLQRIQAVDGQVNAFVEVFAEQAMAEAAAIDQALQNGAKLGPLAGVPVAIKDNFVRRGFASTCCSRILQGFVSPYTSTVVEKLEAAGAVIIGRTNMDEFAMGSSSEHSCLGNTRNPFDLDCIPGGSSGGSAAAVAARMVPLALGSDTGGSVRQPAALCGVSGFKPTYGRISRFGLIAFASSLDHVAPFARDMQDLALLMQVLAGTDAKDSTSLDAAVPDYQQNLAAGSKGLRIGVPEEYFTAGLDAEVQELTRQALAEFENQGAALVPVSMPHTSYAIPAYYLIATSEASSNLSRYDGVKFGQRVEDAEHDLDQMYEATRAAGFGDEVKLRILLGSFCLCSGYYDAYYLKASKVRTLIRQDFEKAFTQCDVLATPTTPTAAFKIGEKLEDPLAMYLSDILTAPANLAGVPSLALPCGYTKAGLPVGLQITGAALDEATVLRTGHAFQLSTQHHLQEPAL